MIQYAIFVGCNIPVRVDHYDRAARAVLGRLGVGLVDIRAFACCGYPLRNSDKKAFVLSSAANLAAAEREGLDIMALCKCCFGTLKEAQHLLSEDEDLKREINRALSERGLQYEGRVKVNHLLSVLYHEVGVDAIREKVVKPYKGFRIATHYGCHALRPSAVTRFDDPVAPSIFDRLVEATGAESVDWALKLECCGAPLTGVNDALSMKLTEKKILSGKQAKADYLCSACPYCQLQFDTVQEKMVASNGSDPLASVLYPQLLGISMGIDEKILGIGENKLDISGVRSFSESGE